MNTLVKTVSQLSFVLTLLFTPVQTQAAVDLFLLLDGVKGDSQDRDYPDAMEIVAWSEGFSIPVQTDIGSGSSVGKASAQSISISKFIDSASPDLRFNLVKGELMPTASIIVRQRTADNSYEQFRIDLTDVRLDSVSAGGSSGEERLMENISLYFSKIKWTYIPVDEAGRPGSKIIRGWDFAKNVAF
jgi:type VI secretion system secreted protein Hcp